MIASVCFRPIADITSGGIDKAMRQLPPNLLQRKLDPRLVMVSLILLLGFGGILIIGLIAGTPHGRSVVFGNLPIGLLLSAVLLAPWFLSDRGYQVGWDDEGVYARLGGWRFEALLSRDDEVARDFGRPRGLLGWFTRPPVSFIRYADIVSIGRPATPKSGPERPAVYINGQASPPGLYHDLIGIDLESFTRSSVLELMDVLRSKRPDIVTRVGLSELVKR